MMRPLPFRIRRVPFAEAYHPEFNPNPRRYVQLWVQAFPGVWTLLGEEPPFHGDTQP